MKHRIRSRLDSLYPEISKRVEIQQEKQKLAHDNKRPLRAAHDNTRPLRQFSVGDHIFAQSFAGSRNRWIEGGIVKFLGPLLYSI